jgi:hypothetical protein
MEVPEPVLYNEVTKLLRQKSFQDRNKYPGPEDIPVPRVAPVKPAIHESGTFHSEHDIIKYLLKYGDEVLYRKVSREEGKETITTVADYIVGEIVSDELIFDNPVFAEIFNDYIWFVRQGLFPGDQHFVKHPNPSISGVSADLLSESYVLSKLYTQKKTYVEKESDKLKELVPQTVLKFKSDKINALQKRLKQELEEAVKTNNIELIASIQKKHYNLSKVLATISKNLNDRIVL